MKIWFDMDGTLADFYNVEGWLPALEFGLTIPYDTAKPMLRMQSFAKRINTLQKKGYEVGIISWGSKGASKEFLERIEKSKRLWLKKHCPSIQWDEILIVKYGTAKHKVCREGILFDDDERNRTAWTEKYAGLAFDEKCIMEVLEGLK